MTGWNPCAVGVEMRVEQSSLPIVEQTPALGLALDNAAAERIQTRKQKARCCVFLGKAGVSVSWSVNWEHWVGPGFISGRGLEAATYLVNIYLDTT